MKKMIVAGFAGVLFLAFPVPSQAGDLYYVELGAADSLEEANQQWQELLDQHTALLGELQYYPRTVIHGGRNKRIHIQAGPIEEKKEANRLCNKLFKNNASCFIVEGLTPEYVKTPKPEPAVESLPWLAAEAATKEEAAKEEGIFSWVIGGKKDDNNSGEATETKMEVAEAIRVPLTEQAAQPTIQMAEAVPPAPIETIGSGWLNIETFANQSEATAFWRQMRAAAPMRAAGLRVLVVRAQARGQMALNIGPFSGEADAMEFCAQTVQQLTDAVICRFAAQDARKRREQSALTETREMKADRSEEYNARRRDQRQEGTKRIDSMASTHARMYWLRLATAKSESEAVALWESIKSENADIVEGMRYSIDPAEEGRYVVRLGPLSTRDEAINTCYILKERGSQCQVHGGL